MTTPQATLCDACPAGSSSSVPPCRICRLMRVVECARCSAECRLVLEFAAEFDKAMGCKMSKRCNSGVSLFVVIPRPASFLHVIGGQQQTCLTSHWSKRGSLSGPSDMRVSCCLLEAGVWRREVGGRSRQCGIRGACGMPPSSSTGGKPCKSAAQASSTGDHSATSRCWSSPKPPHKDPATPL